MSASRSESLRPFLLEAAFCLRVLRLLGAILLEALTTLIRFLFFPLRRRAELARIRRIILGWSAPRMFLAAAALPAVLLVFSSAGCRSTQPGSSFGAQVDEAFWSVHEIFLLEDAPRSLEEDLVTFATGSSPREALWDLEQIFTTPDALPSLENDLRFLGDLDPSDIPETFELFGW